MLNGANSYFIFIFIYLLIFYFVFSFLFFRIRRGDGARHYLKIRTTTVAKHNSKRTDQRWRCLEPLSAVSVALCQPKSSSSSASRETSQPAACLSWAAAHTVRVRASETHNAAAPSQKAKSQAKPGQTRRDRRVGCPI